MGLGLLAIYNHRIRVEEQAHLCNTLDRPTRPIASAPTACFPEYRRLHASYCCSSQIEKGLKIITAMMMNMSKIGLHHLGNLGASSGLIKSTEVIAWPPVRFHSAFRNAIKIGSLPGLPNKALNAKSIFKSMSVIVTHAFEKSL